MAPPPPLARVDHRRSNRRHYRDNQHQRLARSPTPNARLHSSVAHRAALPRYTSTSRPSQQTRHSHPSTDMLISRVANSPAFATRGSRTPIPRRRFVWNARGNTSSNKTTPHAMPRSVVLDALSIGTAGSIMNDGCVALNSILNALSYYIGNGARVVAILPENSHICNIEKKQFRQLVASLRHRGLLVIAPCSGSNFECFILRTANRFGADLVSNNRFELQLLTQQRHGDRAKIAQFLRGQLVPFAFCLGEFVPHPDVSAIASGLHGPRINSAISSAAVANKRW